MMKFDIIDGQDNRRFITYSIQANEKLSTYVLQYLQSPLNKCLLRWAITPGTLGGRLFSDITDMISLSDFILENHHFGDCLTILQTLCRTLSAYEDSLLDTQPCSLKTSDIFLIRHRDKERNVVEWRLYLILLPIITEEGRYITEHYLSARQELLKTVIDNLLKSPGHRYLLLRLRPHVRRRLIEAWAGSPQDILKLLCTKNQTQYKSANKRRRDNATAAAIEKSKADVRAKSEHFTGVCMHKILTQISDYRALPLLLLPILMLLGLYTWEQIAGAIPRAIIEVTLILFIICLLIELLFMIRHLKCILQERKKRILSQPQTPSPGQEINETKTYLAQASARNATLTLLNASEMKHINSWQLFEQEFIISSLEDKGDAYIDLTNDTQELLLRITQKGGFFFAEALGNKTAVLLESRPLHRYEEYLLPDECQLQIAHYRLRFRAY